MRTTVATFKQLLEEWFSLTPPAQLRLTRSQSLEGGTVVRAFFEGDTLYSYGKHWPLARKVIRERDLLLLNCRTRSNTTWKQFHRVRYAAQLSGYTTLGVQDVTAPLEAEADYQLQLIRERDADVLSRPTRIHAAFRWFLDRPHAVLRHTTCCTAIGQPPQRIGLPETLLPLHHVCQIKYPKLGSHIDVA